LPFYNLAAVAHAVELHPKQLDNLLSRNRLPGIAKNGRGLTRRFSREVAVVVRLAIDLGRTLDIPIGTLLDIASRIERGDARLLAVGSFGRLEIDLPALRASVASRLDEAVEVLGRRSRGRPSKAPIP
jgi:hypothetical protein